MEGGKKEYIPESTYRFQLNEDFTFKEAEKLLPYLQELGVGSLYLSPITQAQKGSRHGYDITDPNKINLELGGEEEFEKLASATQAHQMKMLIDFVPNHMAIEKGGNLFWQDVLENGKKSQYAYLFDIHWEDGEGKILLPFLGDHYKNILRNGELKTVYNPENGDFTLAYYDNPFPIDPKTYPHILEPLLKNLESEDEKKTFRKILFRLKNLSNGNDESPAAIEVRRENSIALKKEIQEFFFDESHREALLQYLEKLNGTPRDIESFADLDALITQQHYVLKYWRTAADEINYRRFFDINGLGGLRQKDKRVFDATHKMILRLISEGKIDALRIDHPDGLYDPKQYFQWIQDSVNKKIYVVAEKILAGYGEDHEQIPEKWAVSGTTGYDALNAINGLQADAEGTENISGIYTRFRKSEEIADLQEEVAKEFGDACKNVVSRLYEKMHPEKSVEDMIYETKKWVLRYILASARNYLTEKLKKVAKQRLGACDYSYESLTTALEIFMASYPVYRTYLSENDSRINESDTRYIREAIEGAKKRCHGEEKDPDSRPDTELVIDFIQKTLLCVSQNKNESGHKEASEFSGALQQYTTALIAIAEENTQAYRHFPLSSLNEVGASLEHPTSTTRDFHHFSQELLKNSPNGMVTLSTHDTKRSEDVRARINALSEFPDEWKDNLARWSVMNADKKTNGDSSHKTPQNLPSKNDEYLFYQILLGAWPHEEPKTEEAWNTFVFRIRNYMLKAAKEAKTETSWIDQNQSYENALTRFVELVMDRKKSEIFLDDFQIFQKKIDALGKRNSLLQVVLKNTMPGMPDTYQGNEIFDDSLVDPDNRRSIDFSYRSNLLQRLEKYTESLSSEKIELLFQDSNESGFSGREKKDALKLWITQQTLRVRKKLGDVFTQGDYTPIFGEGESVADHLIAFSRSHGEEEVITVATRLSGKLLKKEAGTEKEAWGEDKIVLKNTPEGVQRRYRDILTGNIFDAKDNTLPLAKVLSVLPVAVLVRA
ncbi:hypothetical protein IPN35_02885 [Candidatus Peregrinibacteria bacterium]|nr:MAG: hypothetical protein IPN35_02885 [Candidatus Peregrinibacteria bacterium]